MAPCAVPEQPLHKPVMTAEVLAALRPRSGGRYLDATLGLGGHTAAILTASSPDGFVLGCDRDGAAIEAATRRLNEAGFAGRYAVRHLNFSELAECAPPDSCDGILLDLGVSSMQLDQADRGFSFQRDGPLDMRMDGRQELTAAGVVNTWEEAGLARLFREYGDEPQAGRIARAIVRERAVRRFETTGQLAALVERCVPRRGQARHPATRVFQAVRMAVNNEEGALQKALAAACPLLKRQGRLAIITFQSIEDRLVKAYGREMTRDYTCPGGVDVPELRQPRAPLMRWVQRKAILPTPVEIAENPRARSAQLRVLEKL